jgi:uncharacterized membrane protein YvbJ
MTYCSHCGAQIADEAFFCPNCGTKTQKGVKENVRYPSDELREVFTMAGAEIERAFNIAAKEMHNAFQNVREDFRNSKQDQNTKSRTSTATVTCKNCGAANETGAVFCRNCGNKIEA